MSLFFKSSLPSRLLGTTGIFALASLLSPNISRADAPRIIEGQALVRWHTFAQSQGLIAPSENKDSNPFRNWAKSVVSARLAKTLRGATVKDVYPNVGWALIELPRGVKTNVGVAQLRSAFGSGNAAENCVTQLTAIPNDSGYAQQWWATKIQAPYAWDASTGSQNVVVAVIDSGSQINNADLQANLWRNTAEIAGDNIDNDGNGYIDDVYGINTVNYPETNEYERGLPPNDTEGHGTHVAGIIGAVGNNSTGIAGVNWRVKIMSLRFIGDSGYGSEAAVLEAIDYVLMMKKRGVNICVTNNSWSSSGKSSAIEDAFRKLKAANIISVCAAGNGSTYYNGSNNDSTPHYPASFTDNSIIAVAATDQNDNRATFSHYGKKSVDLAAPGVSIFSLGLTPSGLTLDGTSMATPMVSGAAALLLSTQPKLSSTQLRSLLLKCIDKVPSLTNVVATGGRLNLARLMGQTRVDVTGQAFVKGKDSRNKSVELPLAGVAVQIVGTNKVTYTDSSGNFSFKELPVGKYTFSGTLTGYKFSSKSLTLSEKKAPAPIKLEGKLVDKKASTYAISGHAYGLTGSPVSGVKVFINNSSEPAATTDSSGSYIINYRAQGTYQLSAQSDRTEWVASTSSVNLPTTTGASVPNAVVDFNVRSSDNTAPSVSIASPLNGSTFTVNTPQTANGSATDSTGIDKLYFTLERNVSGQISYYNWSTSAWTSGSSADGITKELSKSGKSASWSINLPAMVNGAYTLKAWGKDTYGNETAIGAEAVSRWTVGSSSNSARLLSPKLF